MCGSECASERERGCGQVCGRDCRPGPRAGTAQRSPRTSVGLFALLPSGGEPSPRASAAPGRAAGTPTLNSLILNLVGFMSSPAPYPSASTAVRSDHPLSFGRHQRRGQSVRLHTYRADPPPLSASRSAAGVP